MITEEQLNKIATQLPYGAGSEIAKKAKVSEALVSLFLNGKLKAMESKGARRILEECVKYIEKDKAKKTAIDNRIANIV